jgi:hypothetical protein
MNSNSIQNNNNNNNHNNSNNNKSFIRSFLESFKCFVCGNKPEEESDISLKILNLPNLETDIKIFESKLKTFIGILIITDKQNLYLIETLSDLIQNNEKLFKLLSDRFIFYISQNNEIDFFQKNFNNNFEFYFPVFIFLQNSINIKNELTRFEGEKNFDNFTTYLAIAIEEKKRLKKNSNGYIIQQQKKELQKLEEEVQLKEKIEKEKEQKIKEELMKKQIKKEEIKKKLKKELSNNDNNITTISFRFPDGEKRIERSFYLDDTIEDLYSYIYTLENTNFNNENFELIQTFPYKIFNNMKLTLKQENLIHNAVIQIREKD